MVVYSGRTVEQAIEKGLKDLNLPRMKAHIKVISREKKGFLGSERSQLELVLNQ